MPENTTRTTGITAKAASDQITKAQRARQEEAPAVETKVAKPTGAARYGEGYKVPDAMVNFTKWIEREYGFKNVDPRLVTIASKAYGYFQKSDLNK